MDFVAEEVSQKLWSYHQDESGWTLAKTSGDIIISWKPSNEYQGKLYRGQATIEDTPENIIPFMYLPEHRMKWDKSLQSYSILEHIGQETFICHTVTHSYGMGLISSRDFVDLVKVKRYNGGIVTTNSVSVDYPQCPPCSPHIRGHNNACGYVCSPLMGTPSRSQLEVYIQPDLGGMLPRTVVEAALPNNIIDLVNSARAGLKAKTMESTGP
ncbi:stAR-related lipid transfer protein 6 [Paramormyrops kingsleyae]|uniref:stAR-related lipid transfer protein 6 n=1 Tax=Paramormyrops kingsleyae TaxID=1676925 RepID=UPI003B970572